MSTARMTSRNATRTSTIVGTAVNAGNGCPSAMPRPAAMPVIADARARSVAVDGEHDRAERVA